MTLYEINKAIEECLTVNEETGEVTFDEERLAELNEARETKIENIGLYIKNLKADCEAFKAEKQAFEARQKAAANKIASLENYLTYALDGQKFETTKVKISFRKGEKVDVADKFYDNPDAMPFISYNPVCDKVALKKALKNGAEIDGAKLVVSQNVQVK